LVRETYNNGIADLPATDRIATESAPCTGFAADIYDRYVLGLLDQQERANVDRQLQQNCRACINGVQRSMNLWLAFAGSLEHVEPAADFRGRLVRIAELSNRVLTVPKRYKRVREPAVLISSLVVISVIFGTLLVFAWLSGKESSRLEAQSRNTALILADAGPAQNPGKLERLSEVNANAPGKRSLAGHASTASLADDLSEAKAEIQQFKDMMARDTDRQAEYKTIIGALTSPGVSMLTFKTGEGAGASASTAYALVAENSKAISENSKVIFVAANLPPTPDQRVYKLWLVRKDEHYVSLGVFSTDGAPVVLAYDVDKESINSLSGLLVTEEPLTDTVIPSANHLLEAPAAGVAGPAVQATTPGG
jgi:anti-sigma-K factor RskA